MHGGGKIKDDGEDCENGDVHSCEARGHDDTKRFEVAGGFFAACSRDYVNPNVA